MAIAPAAEQLKNLTERAPEEKLFVLDLLKWDEAERVHREAGPAHQLLINRLSAEQPAAGLGGR
ncbi:MAG: hypothetical protein O7E57_09400 [Gammaproteobacteria bacterium]|nr:hypothetical protein [Gammaproteobacteria bacterium]